MQIPDLHARQTPPDGRAMGTDFYQIDALLSAEETMYRDRVRAFMDDEVVPIIAPYWERGEFPFELIPKLLH